MSPVVESTGLSSVDKIGIVKYSVNSIVCVPSSVICGKPVESVPLERVVCNEGTGVSGIISVCFVVLPSSVEMSPVVEGKIPIDVCSIIEKIVVGKLSVFVIVCVSSSVYCGRLVISGVFESVDEVTLYFVGLLKTEVMVSVNIGSVVTCFVRLSAVEGDVNPSE